MRRALLTTGGASALVVTLLALKPHQLPALQSGSPSPRTPVPTATGSGSAARTGTFTGDAVPTQYGAVQVAVTLAKGRITAVKVLQAPDQSGRDQEIASYALPRLTREALGAQSAHIDAVSGASYTSQGYAESLQSALDKAHA
ncbi:FMN-binding protein [Streptomyces sp. J2-1]|uniref:FMN-binding protein n=1 Tax=Streptomyces corallincola TaxID=2851888 RepID=UPI001C381FA2|nr:FMN-binding protein [Streptomyces corallincola]MBV2353368.1 FMN-binding protein [Streptomyces corallincola]